MPPFLLLISRQTIKCQERSPRRCFLPLSDNLIKRYFKGREINLGLKDLGRKREVQEGKRGTRTVLCLKTPLLNLIIVVCAIVAIRFRSAISR